MVDLVGLLDGRPAVVFGHSYGGNVALALAERHPELVQAVGVYETPLSWLDWWPGTTAGADALATRGEPADAAERFMRRLIGDERWQRLPESTRVARRAEGVAMVGELVDLRSHAPWDPSRIRVPAVAIHGTLGAAHHGASHPLPRRRAAPTAPWSRSTAPATSDRTPTPTPSPPRSSTDGADTVTRWGCARTPHRQRLAGARAGPRRLTERRRHRDVVAEEAAGGVVDGADRQRADDLIGTRLHGRPLPPHDRAERGEDGDRQQLGHDGLGQPGEDEGDDDGTAGDGERRLAHGLQVERQRHPQKVGDGWV